MKKIFLSYLTKAINHYLGLDSESKPRLKKLQGKTITVELLPLHFTFQCVFTENHVNIKADELQTADTKICGTPLQMLSVMVAKDERQRFFAEDLIIEGDAEVGQQAVELFDELNIDWEEYFSRVVGDVPAYHAGRFMRGMRAWLQRTEKNFAQDINEFVHEEMGWLPAREALQDFFHDIDTLRMDVDRMEVTIKNLDTYLLEKEE